jgi:hypothetical protein
MIEKNQYSGIRFFRWGDILITLFLLTGIFLSIPIMNSNTPANVEIFMDSEIIAKYPLNQDRELTIQGKTGPMTLCIKNNTVSVIKSCCPHHICVESGAIHFPNAQIVCAPNHILISIKSLNKETMPDGIAR